MNIQCTSENVEYNVDQESLMTYLISFFLLEIAQWSSVKAKLLSICWTKTLTFDWSAEKRTSKNRSNEQRKREKVNKSWWFVPTVDNSRPPGPKQTVHMSFDSSFDKLSNDTIQKTQIFKITPSNPKIPLLLLPSCSNENDIMFHGYLWKHTQSIIIN